MKRIVFLIAAIFFASINVESAQDVSAAQRTACKGGHDTFCEGTVPGGGRALVCLSKPHDALSDACTQVVDAHKK